MFINIVKYHLLVQLFIISISSFYFTNEYYRLLRTLHFFFFMWRCILLNAIRISERVRSTNCEGWFKYTHWYCKCAVCSDRHANRQACGVSDQYLFIHLKKNEFYDNNTINFVCVAIRSAIVMYIFFDICHHHQQYCRTVASVGKRESKDQ